MKNPDILAATKPVAEAFEKLGILYYIGGSVASSTYGIPRSLPSFILYLLKILFLINLNGFVWEAEYPTVSGMMFWVC